MTRKAYDWANGAVLEDHTRKKHTVLRQYVRQYLITRCQNPHQEKFRLVIVDAFAGGGIYECGNHGSPLLFADELSKTTVEINVRRARKGLKPVAIECLLLLNDSKASVVEQLKQNIAPILAEIKDNSPQLTIKVEIEARKFEDFYDPLVRRVNAAKCRNVLFNLDQCGYSSVTGQVVADIMARWRSSEVFLTFAIEPLLAFLTKKDHFRNLAFDGELQDKIDTLQADAPALLTAQEWLGNAEQIVFTHFSRCAPYVSPFSINNPSGWRYWLMHFANSHRARQVYNDILHEDSAIQAHFGRPGLRMLSYDPTDECHLYLFDDNSRELARDALIDEIPALLAESGNAMPMLEFYEGAYSATPAHTDDIHQTIIENGDIEVITERGGRRRKPGTIHASDTLRLKSQRSLFFMFGDGHVDGRR